MHEESSTLTYVVALNNQTSFRTLIILNPLTYHVLQFCNPAKLGLVGHQLERKEAAQNKLLTCLSTSCVCCSFKCRAPQTVSSTVSILPPHETLRFSLPHLASFADQDPFLPTSMPLTTDRREEEPTLL